jgi:hypothetical protein
VHLPANKLVAEAQGVQCVILRRHLSSAKDAGRYGEHVRDSVETVGFYPNHHLVTFEFCCRLQSVSDLLSSTIAHILTFACVLL